MRLCATTFESELTDEERDALIRVIQFHRLKHKYLEIGTAAGGTLWKMMCSFPENKRPQFVVVDPMSYFPNQLDIVRKNLSSHNIDPDTVDFRIATSEAAFSHAAIHQETFDFILIDGNHKIRYVIKDLLWARLLNVGGLLCLHDFSPKYPGVWTAVYRFLKNYPNYQKVEQVDKLIILKKIAPSPIQEITRWDLWFAKILAPLHQIQSSIRKRINKDKY